MSKSEEKVRDITENTKVVLEENEKEFKKIQKNYYDELEEFKNGNEFLRNKNMNLEKDLNDKEIKMKHDKELQENRELFLTNKIEDLKSEKNDMQAIIDNLKYEIIEYKEDKNMLIAEIKNLKEDYENKIFILQEAHKSLYYECTEKIENQNILKQELDQLKNQSSVNKKDDPQKMMNKLQELINNLDEEKEKNDDLRREYDKKIKDLKDLHLKEREVLNKKLINIEKDFYELDSKNKLLNNEISNLKNIKQKYESEFAIFEDANNNQIERIRYLEDENYRLNFEFDRISKNLNIGKQNVKSNNMIQNDRGNNNSVMYGKNYDLNTYNSNQIQNKNQNPYSNYTNFPTNQSINFGQLENNNNSNLNLKTNNKSNYIVNKSINNKSLLKNSPFKDRNNFNPDVSNIEPEDIFNDDDNKLGIDNSFNSDNSNFEQDNLRKVTPHTKISGIHVSSLADGFDKKNSFLNNSNLNIQNKENKPMSIFQKRNAKNINNP